MQRVTTRTVQAGEVFLNIMHAYGIKDIFSSPGSEWPPVWEALAKYDAEKIAGPRYWNTRHESLAVSMALGYTKASGRPTGVLLHASVGPLHAAMALRAAHQEHIPMVVAAGESNTYGEDPAYDPGAQWLRHLSDVGGPARVVAPYVKWSNTVNSLESLPGMLQHACRIALTPPQGPAFLSIPMELLLRDVPVELIPRPTPPGGPTLPDPALLDQAAHILATSRSPLIITEEAGRDPENVARLVALAERLSIPVLEAQGPAYLNFPRNHPLHIGFDAKPFLKEADAVLLLGVRGPWHPPSAGPGSETTVILADEDPVKSVLPSWGYSVDVTIAGSLGATLEGILARITTATISASIQEAIRERRARWQAVHQRQREGWAREAQEAATAKPIDVRWAAQVMEEVLPKDAITVEEITVHRPYVIRQLARHLPGTQVSRMTGGLGVGMGTAQGVKLARPEALVVSLVGDGAFSYNPALASLGFAQEYQSPILIIVFNNASYAAMKSSLQKYYPGGWSDRTGVYYGSEITPAPDYAALAPSFGGFGVRVEDPAQLKPALEQALEAVRQGRLALVDLVLSKEDPR